MKTLLLIVLIVCAASMNLHAAEVWQRIDAELYGCAHVSDSRIICVGEAGKIIVSDSQGQKWEWRNSESGQSLFSVDFNAAGEGVAVGAKGTILHSADRGDTWEEIPSAVSVDLRRVQFATPDTVYCVGYAGTVLRSVDGGKSWTTVRQVDSDTLAGMYFVDGSCGTAVGWHGVIIQTTDAGETWQKRVAGNPGHLYSVAFRDRLTGIALGFAGTACLTSDGGQTWTEKSEISPFPLFDVQWIGEQTVVAVGTVRSIFTSNDGGRNWTGANSSADLSNTTFFYDVAFDESGSGVTAGSNNAILSSQNSGQSWEIDSYLRLRVDLTAPIHNQSLKFSGNGVALMVGSEGSIHRSIDGGTSWTKRATGFPGVFSDIHLSNSTSGFVVGVNGNITRTEDGGESWTRSVEFGIYNLKSLDFITVQHGFLLGDTTVRFTRADGTPSVGFRTVLVETRDGGDNWDVRHFTGLGNPAKILFVSEQTGFILAEHFDTVDRARRPKLLRTNNAGTTWDTLDTGADSYFTDMAFTSESVGFLVGQNGTILRTVDGGDSWHSVSSDASSNLTSVAFLNDKQGFIAGPGLGTNRYLYTSDGGDRWSSEEAYSLESLDSQVPRSIFKVFIPSDSTVFLSGSSTLLRKTFPSTTTSVEHEFLTPGSSLDQIATFPNPVDSDLTLKLNDLPISFLQEFSLKIFDMAGNQHSGPAAYSYSGNELDENSLEVTVTTGHLPRGVYFAEISGGEVSRIVKFLIAR